MHMLSEYALFLAEVVTFVLAALFLLTAVMSMGQKQREQGKLKVQQLNQQIADTCKQISELANDKKSRKALAKQLKQQHKQLNEKPRCFVIDFKGDIFASAVESLREEVTAILSIANSSDRVLVRLESPGGVVPGYGLAAAQLQRLKDKQIPLDIAVDKVAASGGYLMACLADTLIASPFAIIGSIGVLTQLPNFHRWLKRNDIDFEQITAGQFKRTLTMFGENDEPARQKMQQDLQAIHDIFKSYILRYRQVDIEKVATGEYWLGHDAKALGLVDQLGTSDDYLLGKIDTWNLLSLRFSRKKRLGQKLHAAAHSIYSGLTGQQDSKLPFAM
jgi:serine protease SohB